MRPRGPIAAAALAVAGLLVAACGGSHSAEPRPTGTAGTASPTRSTAAVTTTTTSATSPSPSTTSTTAPASAPPDTPPPVVPPKATVRAAMLVRADLPTGFRPIAVGPATPAATSAGDHFVSVPKACGDAMRTFDDPSHDDPDLDRSFQNGSQSVQIEQQIDVGADIGPRWDQFAAALAGPCKARVRVSSGGAFGGSGHMQAERVPAIGDASLALRLDFTIGSGRSRTLLTGYAVFIRRGATVDTISVSAVTVPALNLHGPAITLADLLPTARKADAKLARALG